MLCQVGGGLKFVDLATLELMELESGHLRGQEFTNKTLWASADGRAYGAGLGGLIAAGLASGAGTVTLKLVGPTGLEKASGQFPSLYAVPDPTGRYLFAGGHGVYDLALGKTKDAVRSEDPSPREPPVHYYLPAVDGPFYLRYHATAFPFPGMVPPFRPVGPPGAGGPPGFPGVPPGFPGAPPGGRDADETGVTIYGYGQAKPVARLKDADPLAGRPADPFSLARVADQLFLIPRAKVLVVFRPRDLTIELVPIDLEAEMAKSGVEVPWVTSVPPPTFKGGAEVRYPLKVVSRAGGVMYSLDDPPAGMAVSADGVLTWKPPADTPAEVRVTVRVRDAKGGESVHSFPLTRAN
jgi:hypothetical protein